MRKETFKEIRLITGYSPTALAKILDVSRQTISNYENGHRRIPDDMADRLTNYFGQLSDRITRIIETSLPS